MIDEKYPFKPLMVHADTKLKKVSKVDPASISLIHSHSWLFKRSPSDFNLPKTTYSNLQVWNLRLQAVDVLLRSLTMLRLLATTSRKSRNSCQARQPQSTTTTKFISATITDNR